MRKLLRRNIRLVGASLIVTLTVAVSAECLSTVQTMLAHACCVMMGHDCGTTAIEKSCCPPSSLKPASTFSRAEASKMVAPALVVSALLPNGADVVDRLARPRLFELDLTPTSSPPSHLLFSVFRI